MILMVMGIIQIVFFQMMVVVRFILIHQALLGELNQTISLYVRINLLMLSRLLLQLLHHLLLLDLQNVKEMIPLC